MRSNKMIQAYVNRKDNEIKKENLFIGEPGLNQVLIKMVACGVCHTDAVVMNNIMPVPRPSVLGHEGVGIVEEVGPGVLDLAVGDHVVMSYPSCGICDACRKGHPYACKYSSKLFWGGAYFDGTKKLTDEEGTEVSVMFGQGAFAQYAIANTRYCVKVDPDVDLKMLSSLGCGIQTGASSVINVMHPVAGDSIVVFGTGAVGLSAVMAARICGCSQIIAVDIVEERLSLAKELGATDVINSKEVSDVAAEVKKLTGGEGAVFSFESTGHAELIVTALDSLRSEGTEVFVSATGPQMISFMPDLQMMSQCKTLTGVVEGASDPQTFIPLLVQFYKEGKLPLDKITKFYSFDELDKAFEDSHTGATIKPVIVF